MKNSQAGERNLAPHEEMQGSGMEREMGSLVELQGNQNLQQAQKEMKQTEVMASWRAQEREWRRTANSGQQVFQQVGSPKEVDSGDHSKTSLRAHLNNTAPHQEISHTPPPAAAVRGQSQRAKKKLTN
jgi:hypothetical protein